MGEHAVVYGKPAIGTHLSRGIRVSLIRTEKTARLPLERKLSPLDERGRKAYLAAAREAGLDPNRFSMKISSRLPAGQGLGSSAALSVAVSRALLLARGKKETDERVVHLAQIMEGVFHGRPSGIDATIALGKGPVLYRKKRPPEEMSVGRPITVILLLSGTSPSTKTMVEKVRKKYEKNRAETIALINDIESLVMEALGCIEKGSVPELGRVMNENHGILKKLGVSTKNIESLRDKALRAGSPGAKLTGGGGGGAVICLAENRRHAKEIMKKLNMDENSFITIIKQLF